MHRTLATALALAVLAVSPPAEGQEGTPSSDLRFIVPAATPASSPAEDFVAPAGWSHSPFPSPARETIPPTGSFAAAAMMERSRQRAAGSLSRHVVLGAGIGALAGAALGLWVISIADCGGPGCTAERVLGVAGNALGGAAIGALIGAVVHRIRR